MNVPFIDLKEQYHAVQDQVVAGVTAIFEKGNFILGEEEKAFEDSFARYCGAKYAIGVNSGTDALYLALLALHVGPGDEVIVPTYTFIATALAVSYTGAKPVFVDIQEDTYNIDPEKIKAAITKKTKVIIAVHLYGQPANIKEIRALAKTHNIFFMEDAAQSHGATYQGAMIGSVGDVSCFSFYPTKSLGAFGDGGMIVTSTEEVARRAYMLRDYGRTGRYEHKIIGFNSRLDTVQAVVLAAKLPHLDLWNRMRNKAAAYYCELLGKVPGVVAPTISPERTHVFQTFAIRVQNRDAVSDGMKEKGIGVLIHYPIPIHLQEAYAASGHKKGDFPVAEKVSAEILSLPMFPHITKTQIEYVCRCLEELVA